MGGAKTPPYFRKGINQMYREIKVGEKMVPMVANAATALRYKHVFGKDLIVELQQAQGDTAKGFNSLPELAFVMAKAAEAKEGKVNMGLLNEENFMDWLEQFDSMDIVTAAEAVINLYMGNSEASVEQKKEGGGVSES